MSINYSAYACTAEGSVKNSFQTPISTQEGFSLQYTLAAPEVFVAFANISPYYKGDADCLIRMTGIWRETGAHLVSCITLVCFVTVTHKFDQRILNAQGLF